VGADLVAAATRDLNTVILHCHGARIASRQAVQFRLADMMAGVEVAGALCRRAAGMEKDGEAWAAMARACARRVLADVRRGAVQCLIGYLDPADEAAKAAARAVADALHSADPFPAHLGLLEDLGAVTDHLKTCVD